MRFIFGALCNQKEYEGRNYNEFFKKKKREKKKIVNSKINTKLTKYLACPQHQYQTKEKKLYLPSFSLCSSKEKKANEMK